MSSNCSFAPNGPAWRDWRAGFGPLVHPTAAYRESGDVRSEAGLARHTLQLRYIKGLPDPCPVGIASGSAMKPRLMLGNRSVAPHLRIAGSALGRTAGNDGRGNPLETAILRSVHFETGVMGPARCQFGRRRPSGWWRWGDGAVADGASPPCVPPRRIFDGIGWQLSELDRAGAPLSCVPAVSP
jgi:hypothetical protein